MTAPQLSNNFGEMEFGHRNQAEDDEDEVEDPGIYETKMSLFSKHNSQSHHPHLQIIYSNRHYSHYHIHYQIIL